MADDDSTGRTRWGVFALVFVAGMAGVGVLLTGLSQGALAASFTVSGTSYKASADDLRAAGVVQYGSVDHSADRTHPVLVNGFRSVQADNFCQSVLVGGLPGIGELTFRISAPGKAGMAAQNLVLGIEDVQGDFTLSDVEIGKDSGTFDKGPTGLQGQPGGFGIQSDRLHIGNLRQVAWSTTASTLRLNQVHINATAGRHECF